MQLWDFSNGLNNKFDPAMVHKPSVFKPLNFYCIYLASLLCSYSFPLYDLAA